MANRTESDAIHYSSQIRGRLDELVDRLHAVIQEVDEPQAMALCETSAEVLKGLRTAFEHYEKKNEAAWRPSEEN